MSCAGRGILLRQIDRLFGDGTLASVGDGQLLERFLASGDETAFEALVDRHGPMVLGLCRRMLRDPRDVEDAFQATFLVLVRTGGAIRDRSLVSTWLYRVAFRVARQARAQTLRRRNYEVAVVGLDVATEPDANDMLNVGPVLDQELSRLPEKYRAPLVLCYLEGRTHDQAAEALRCPVGTVRSRLARGRDLLRKRLTRGGYTPTAALLAMNQGATLRLMSESVSPSLVSHTLKLVLRSGSAPTIQAGAAAASVLVLTRGVLTTMKLTRLKWIGLSLLATGLSAGGAVAVSYARPGGSHVGPDKGLAPADVISLATAPELQSRARSPLLLKGWGEAIDPDGDCSFDLVDGRLTITVPAPARPSRGHGLEAEGNMLNAPRVLREIEGDFIADLKVVATFKPAGPSANPRASPFVGAGLLLWNDAGNYFRLERAAIDRNGQLIPYALFEERRDSQLLPPFGGMQLPEGPVVLRLERKGDQISGSVSPDGTNWRSFPPRSVKFPAKLKLGVAAISSSRQPFVVTLEKFRVLRPE
jgi:RNA polymerase sigma factor (sigma-70 family)